MGFGNNRIAKIWAFSDKGSYGTCNMSTSRKDKQTGKYVNDFNDGFVRVCSAAYTFLKNERIDQKNGLTVRLGDIDVQTRYDQDKKMKYTNYTVFSMDKFDSSSPAPSQNNTQASYASTPVPPAPVAPSNDRSIDVAVDEEELPF